MNSSFMRTACFPSPPSVKFAALTPSQTPLFLQASLVRYSFLSVQLRSCRFPLNLSLSYSRSFCLNLSPTLSHSQSIPHTLSSRSPSLFPSLSFSLYLSLSIFSVFSLSPFLSLPLSLSLFLSFSLCFCVCFFFVCSHVSYRYGED